MYRSSTDIVRRFLRREIPVYGEGTANVVAARALPPLPGAPRVDPTELRSMALRWAYRSTKAKRVLGWSPGPHEECLEQTVAWHREPHEVRPAGTRQPLALRAAGATLRRAESLLTRRP